MEDKELNKAIRRLARLQFEERLCREWLVAHCAGDGAKSVTIDGYVLDLTTGKVTKKGSGK